MLERVCLFAVTAALAAVTPSIAFAQKLGQGGTGVDETTQLPQCPVPLGVAALVETKAADPADALSPQLQALMRMAEMQNGGSTARVDALPLVKLMIARSNCFRVADRGEAFSALERERAIAGATAATRPVTKADYLIEVKVVYSDAKSRESGGGIGGVFGGAVGLKSKTLESQVLMTLVDVNTGIQEAVASGSARKKDVGVIGGGVLLGLGVGAAMPRPTSARSPRLRPSMPSESSSGTHGRALSQGSCLRSRLRPHRPRRRRSRFPPDRNDQEMR